MGCTGTRVWLPCDGSPSHTSSGNVHRHRHRTATQAHHSASRARRVAATERCGNVEGCGVPQHLMPLVLVRAEHIISVVVERLLDGGPPRQAGQLAGRQRTVEGGACVAHRSPVAGQHTLTLARLRRWRGRGRTEGEDTPPFIALARRRCYPCHPRPADRPPRDPPPHDLPPRPGGRALAPRRPPPPCTHAQRALPPPPT